MISVRLPRFNRDLHGSAQSSFMRLRHRSAAKYRHSWVGTEVGLSQQFLQDVWQVISFRFGNDFRMSSRSLKDETYNNFFSATRFFNSSRSGENSADTSRFCWNHSEGQMKLNSLRISKFTENPKSLKPITRMALLQTSHATLQVKARGDSWQTCN